MKPRISLALSVSLFVLVGMLTTAGAESPVTPAPGTTVGNADDVSFEGEPVHARPFLLWMKPPCAGSQGGCSPESLPAVYLEQARAQMHQMLPLLGELRAQGLVADFLPIPDANAVSVTASKDALPNLETLPGVVKITQGGAEEVSAARQSLEKGIEQAIQADVTTLAVRSAIAAPSTDPSVYVDDTSETVWGYTTANASVSVTLRNSGGGTKATATTTANSNG